VPIRFDPVPDYTGDLKEAHEYQADILGPVWEDAVPVVPMNDLDNFVAAVDKRVNYLDESRLPKSVLQDADNLLNLKIPEVLDQIEWSQEMFEEWVQDYPIDKQDRLRTAAETFQLFTQGDFANKEVFTKVEALLKRHDDDWAGRIVNASSDLHNAMSGPILTTCLRRLNACLDPVSQPGDLKCILAYKCGPRKIIDFLAAQGKCVLEADFSSNDSTQVKDVQGIECKWLRRLGAPEWLVLVMAKANTYNVFSRKFGMSGKLRYQLPSGSTSTTFRNCIWNLTQAFGWASRNGVTGRIAVLGDDMIMVVDTWRYRKQGRRHAARSYTHYTALARMKAKVKAHTTLCQAEFLSKVFVPAGEDYVMLPKLGRVLAKFNVRATVNTNLSDLEWMAGKSLSMCWETRYIPLVSAIFLERFRDTGVSIDSVKESSLSWGTKYALGLFGSTRALVENLFETVTPPATDEEFYEFSWFRYNTGGAEVIQLIEETLFGEDDIYQSQHWPLSSVDFY
jgi:hypothetical protein